MSLRSKLSLCTVFAGALAFAAPAFAHGGGFHRDGDHDEHFDGGGFHYGFRRMPPRGFDNVPHDFHGHYPRAATANSRFHGDWHGWHKHNFGTFHGRRYSDFGRHDREAWEHGRWRHVEHDGHLAWWWDVDGSWFFYPTPIYPYPTYIGPGGYYDYYNEVGAPPYYWYYCEDPQGYYPYVTHCDVQWEPVPPVSE